MDSSRQILQWCSEKTNAVHARVEEEQEVNEELADQ